MTAGALQQAGLAELEEGRCCLCGGRQGSVVVRSSDVSLKTTGETFSFIKCKRCGALFLDPRPTKRWLGKFYPEGSYYARDLPERAVLRRASPEAGVKSKLQRRVLELYGLIGPARPSGFLWRLTKLLVLPLLVRNSALLRTLISNRVAFTFQKRPARVLEVGFGDGLLLAALRWLDLELWGTEISGAACEFVSRAFGAKTFCGEVWEAGYPDEYFDLVIFSHSLEHISEPLTALNEAHRITVPGGRLLLSLPNPSSWSARVLGKHWIGYDVPRHLFLFGPGPLRALVERAGFAIVRVSFPVEGSLHHLIESLNLVLRFRLFPDWLSRFFAAQLLYMPVIWFRRADVMTVLCRRA